MPLQTRTDDPNVHVTSYDPAVLRYLYPEWDALTDAEKLTHIRANRPDPREAARLKNVTTKGLHNYLASAIDPEQDAGDRYTASLAVGTGGNAGASITDESMNAHAGRVGVTDTIFSPTTSEVQVTTFIDSTRLNEITIDELGVEDNEETLWNHAVLTTPIEKTNVKTLVVDVYFTITSP